jgi:hypothetical protein
MCAFHSYLKVKLLSSKNNLQVDISKASLVKEVLGELAQTNICEFWCAYWCAHTWKITKTLYNLVLIW